MRHPVYLGHGQPPAGCKTWGQDTLDKNDADSVAFFLVGQETTEVLDQIRHIRGAEAPAIYLKPIVVLTPSASGSPAEQAADAVVEERTPDAPRLERMVDRFHPINQWIASLERNALSADGDPAFRLLRFLVSRGEEVTPVMTTASPEGFTYPTLEPLISQRAQKPSLLETLSFLENQQLVSGRFVTKAHFCSHCGSAFLNFKEVCPDCLSEDIDADELIHHFRCGHVAPQSDFATRDGLTCPKCDRELRHIGVDYDKPSVVFQCNNCHNRFQSPSVVSTCYHCERTVEPEQQTLRRIHAWTPTAIGNSAAVHGMEQLFMRVIDKQLNLWSLDALKQFVEVEKARNERYAKSHTSVAVLQFEHLSEMYIQLGRRAQQVFAELAQVLTSVLRRSDIIAPRGDSTFVLVLPETDEEQAQRALERIDEGISTLLAGNLESPPVLRSSARLLTAELDLDQLVETTVTSHG
ncbi:diguanylate cyclase [Guyparkeria hydrothermalis]|uniref:TackOD1 domain-containing metal-binding protein n=1 Tax=Guyparkeria hydrothermalis TaxID=923 RepID=UPI00202090C4|nr:diguanylate cyclase [Guyparkeria hydrothermalis]MCL7744736.1 diguanylate cyclase [Guyparkeria hydrothermalis]